MVQALAATGRATTWGDTVTAQPLSASSRLDAIEAFSRQLAVSVERALRQGHQGMAGFYGWRGKLLPAHVVVIGARSYEPAEAELLAAHQVRVMTMEEVLDCGFAACFDEARAIVKRDTAGWGLTLDLDGLDPLDAPGTGTPVETGIRLADAVHVLASSGRARPVQPGPR